MMSCSEETELERNFDFHRSNSVYKLVEPIHKHESRLFLLNHKLVV